MSAAENSQRREHVSRALMEKAAEAALSAEGVSSMNGTLTDTLKTVPGLPTPVRGVKMSDDDDRLDIDLHINVYYRTKIPQLAWDIQRKVKKAMEEACSLPVREINIHVDGVEAVEERE
ncbi:Asp23/Gls24 family envelope stress response protein [Hornefia butyriciproducens]|uniref:Asp23/Gls24 family envelope stress response protein n=1 Tax=Hornefia butyriciproducens TaxID=2652293 RepID=A0A6L5Y6P7_9FIRM|nr:Asp23/Gls24 family envelope stress response protein [Hornefia butyriciproducens]MDY5424511.1 Asp23/Gls24 family envelope stress response protein [Hornefia butyriciproducens]MST52125.1 Asp23/Gls24 family envelope stress response protein [Hornefia butyriciproducens]